VRAVRRLTAEDRVVLWSDRSWPQDIGAREQAALETRVVVRILARRITLDAVHA
jgi:hypothetical protein